MRFSENAQGAIQSKWVPTSDSVIDRPFARGNAGQLHFVQAFGRVLGIPQLAQASADSKPDNVMVRANNMGAVVAQILLKLPADVAVRERALEEFGGVAWTQSVLRTAKTFPGATGIADAVRASLMMHFLTGILDSEAGRLSMYSEAYQRTVKYIRNVERQKKEAAKQAQGGIERLAGLSQLTTSKSLTTGLTTGTRLTTAATFPAGSSIDTSSLTRAAATFSADTSCTPRPSSLPQATAPYVYKGRSGRSYNIPADCATWQAAPDYGVGDEFGPMCGTTKYQPFDSSKPGPSDYTAFTLRPGEAYFTAMSTTEGLSESQTALRLGLDGAVYITVGNRVTWHNGIGRPAGINETSFPTRWTFIGGMERLTAGMYQAESFLGVSKTSEVAPGVPGIDSTSLQLVRSSSTRVLTLLGRQQGTTKDLVLWTGSSSTVAPTHRTSFGTTYTNPFDAARINFLCDGSLEVVDVNSGAVLWSAASGPGYFPNKQWLTEVVQPSDFANNTVWPWSTSGLGNYVKGPNGALPRKYPNGKEEGYLFRSLTQSAGATWFNVIQNADCGGLTKQDKFYNTIGAFRSVFQRNPTIDELAYYLSMSWCTNNGKMNPFQLSKPGDSDDTMRGVMRRIRDHRPYLGTMPNPQGCTALSPQCPVTDKDFADRSFFARLETATVEALDSAVTVVSDVLCSAFKSLFGESVGGVFCAVFTAIIRFVGTALATSIQLISTTVTALVKFIQILGTGRGAGPDGKEKNYDAESGGRILGALYALLSGVTEVLFVMMAPVAVPLLFAADPGNKTAIASGLKELKEMAQKVAQKNPLFPIIAIMAIISCVLTPTPSTIVGLIVALIPIAAIILAKVLKQGDPATGQASIPLFKDIPLDSTPAARGLIDMTEQFLKATVILIQGLMTVPELVEKFKVQLKNWMGNNPDKSAFFPKGDPGKSAAENTSAFISNLKMRLTAIYTSLQNILQTGLKDFTKQALNILALVPVLLLAIFEPAVSADPTLKQLLDKWMVDQRASAASIDEYQNKLKQSARDIVGLLTPAEQMALIDEQIRNQGIDEAGALVGRQLAQRLKPSTVNQVDKERFILAAKAAYGPVN